MTSEPDPSEGAVLRLPVGGPASFDDFYRREHRPLLRLAWTLVGRRDLAEELVQDTMLSVHRRWGTVRGYDSPGSFARRVLLNGAASAARRRVVERAALARVQAMTTAPPDEAPPDDELWSAMRALPERQAQTVALHYLEDRSVADIAIVLGIAESTVKVHLHRGRLALARSLHHQDGAG